MSARAALFLILALPAFAGADEITFWDGAALKTQEDPHAAVRALRADPQTFGAMAGDDVGLFIEEASGAPVYVSNLIEGAMVRRFSGHVALQKALSAGRLITLAPTIAAYGREVVVDWRVYNERRIEIAAFSTKARMSGAEETGRPFAAFTQEDAERIAFQAASAFEEVVEIIDEEAIARIDRTPTPRARPQDENETLRLPPPDAPQEPRKAPPVPLSRPE